MDSLQFRHVLDIVAVFAMLGVFPYAEAQVNPPGIDPASDCATLPSVKVGSWVVVDGSGRKVKSTITEVDDAKITLKRESQSGINRDNGTDTYSREWAVYTGPATSNPAITVTYAPSFNLFKFPMCVGDSREQKVNWQVQSGSASGVFTLRSKVAAKEKIGIAGREIEVYRVEWDSGSQGGTTWYSPELARSVKSETKLNSWVVVEHGGP